MATNRFRGCHQRKKDRNHAQSGQAIVFMVLVLGLFLLGAVAFSVDMGNLWFHRQAAQSAADAACVAGAMDMLVDSQGGATGHQGFTIGTAFDCSAHSAYIPCKYAALNGYDGANSTPGNQVYVSFPATVAGATAPPAGISPQSPGGTAFPFMRVDVLDHVQTYFAGLLSGSRTQDVRTFAACGTLLATAPIPLLVLDPVSPSTTPAKSALNIQGSGAIKIVGGPTQSIQVNSKLNASSCSGSNCSVNLPWGSATIDLSQGGPPPSGASIGAPGTGSDFGLYGGPSTAPAGFLPGTTGHWVPHSPPIDDPFAQVCAPGQTGCPNINGNAPPAVPGAPAVPADETGPPSNCTSIPCTIPYHDANHGCPDPGGCYLYTPGSYASNICVGTGGCTFHSKTTAVFDPGLYYVTGGLTLNPGSVVRPSSVTTGIGGTVFYFSGSGTVQVDSNSGKPPYTTDAFDTSAVKCTPTSNIPNNLPASLQGNILLGACTGYYGDALGASDPNGVQRGFLFFQDRAATSVQPTWGGGGQFLLAGTMYFHSCNATGTGTGCGTAAGAGGSYYNDVLSLSGNSGSGTYVLGQIITDNLSLGGTSGITMDLNPTVAFNILKATLLR